MSEIWCRKEGRAGRITLQRPKALNALTEGMLKAIEAAIDEWTDDDDVALVMIDAEGDRAHHTVSIASRSRFVQKRCNAEQGHQTPATRSPSHPRQRLGRSPAQAILPDVTP